MSSHITLQIAEPDRLNELLPLFRAYQSSYADFAGASLEQTREFLAGLLGDSRGGFVVLALDGARVVGFATAFATVSGILAARMIHLGDLFVAPEHRGRQIGAQLVRAVQAEAARRGIPLVRWLSVAANEKLNAWYAKLGAKSYDFKLFIAPARDA